VSTLKYMPISSEKRSIHFRIRDKMCAFAFTTTYDSMCNDTLKDENDLLRKKQKPNVNKGIRSSSHSIKESQNHFAQSSSFGRCTENKNKKCHLNNSTPLYFAWSLVDEPANDAKKQIKVNQTKSVRKVRKKSKNVSQRNQKERSTKIKVMDVLSQKNVYDVEGDDAFCIKNKSRGVNYISEYSDQYQWKNVTRRKSSRKEEKKMRYSSQIHHTITGRSGEQSQKSQHKPDIFISLKSVQREKAFCLEHGFVQVKTSSESSEINEKPTKNEVNPNRTKIENIPYPRTTSIRARQPFRSINENSGSNKASRAKQSSAFNLKDVSSLIQIIFNIFSWKWS